MLLLQLSAATGTVCEAVALLVRTTWHVQAAAKGLPDRYTSAAKV